MFLYKVSKSSGKIVKLKNNADLFNNFCAYVRNPDKLPDTVHSIDLCCYVYQITMYGVVFDTNNLSH